MKTLTMPPTRRFGTATEVNQEKPSVPPQAPQVAQQVEELHRISEENLKLMEVLECRLSPIVTQEPQTPEGSTASVAEEVLVPVAQSLKTIKHHQYRLASRLNSLLDRIQI